MSLIHEALKQAESQASQGQATFPSPFANEGLSAPGPRRGRTMAVAAITVTTFAVVIGAVTMAMLRHEGRLPAPISASKEEDLASTPAAAPAETPKVQAPVKVAVHDSPEGLAGEQESEPPTDNAARFKVSAVMSGPTGQAALVNGQMVHLGGMVDGARLVGISGDNVELDVGMRRVTVALHRN